MALFAMIPADNFVIQSHNIDSSLDPAMWTSTNYFAGEEVSHNNIVYRALLDTDEEPGTGTDWFEIGLTNLAKSQDAVVITKTVATASDNSIEMTIKADGNFISLLGVKADTVYIDGEKIDMRLSVADKWEYRTAPIEFVDKAFKQVRFRKAVTIRLERASGPAELGKISYARQFKIGILQLGNSDKMTDYSLVEKDTFGIPTALIERGYAQDINFSFKHPLNTAQRHFDALAALRAKPMIYVETITNRVTLAILREVSKTDESNLGAQFSGFLEGVV